MYRVIILLVIFLAVFYVITYFRVRKKRELLYGKSTIGEYKHKYRIQRTKRANETDALFDDADTEDQRIDFMDKEELLRSVKEEAEGALPKENRPQIKFKF